MGRKLGVLGMVAAIAVGGTVVPARAVAGAGLGLPDLGLSPPGSLSAAFNNSSTSWAKALACPVAQQVDGVVPQLSSVVCALNVLGYAIRTTYIKPDGTKLVRYASALVGIPRTISVDGTGLPDFIVEVLPTLAPLGVNVSVTRLLTFPASAKVSVEVVVVDPAASNTYVGVGEDGTTSGTATVWSLGIGVLGLSTSGVDLGVTMRGIGLPSSAGLLGEEFSGPNPDSPTNVSRGDVQFTPAVSAVATEIKLGQTSQEVAVTSSAPTLVKANVQLISPGDEKDVDATIDRLPVSVDIVHQAQTDGDTITYLANATINSLTASYRDTAGSQVTTAAEIDATGVPTQLTFEQNGATTTMSAAPGVIGSVEARYGQGTGLPAPGAGTGPYVAFHRLSTSMFTAGVRILDLQSLSVDAAGPYTADLVLGEGAGQLPFSAEDDVSGITANGTLSNLPAHTTVTIDLSGGTLTFDGHGTGIQEIDLKATDGHGAFFARASRIDATVVGIAANETINFLQGDGALTVSATPAITSISLLASDGSGPPNVSGPYASYIDIPSSYQAYVHLDGISSVSFAGDPLSGTLDTTAPQTLKFLAETSFGTASGTIADLPSHLSFAVTPGTDSSEVVDFQASAPIDTITLDATGLPLPLHGTNLHAEIDNLPSHMTLTLPADGGTVALSTYGDHIGHVLAQVWDANGPIEKVPATAPAGEQGLIYIQQDNQLTVDLRQVGPFSATESTTPFNLQYDISSESLYYQVNVQTCVLITDICTGPYILGTISNPEPASISLTPDGGNLVGDYHVNPNSPNFTGDGQINSISFTTNAGTANGFFNGTLTNVPANLHICAQAGSGTTCVPPFVPTTFDDGQGDPSNLPDPSVALEFVPTDLNGHVPANPLTLNGVFCPDTGVTADCAANTRFVVTDLAFNTLDMAFASRGDDCSLSVYCGDGWLAFNTNNQPLSGDVKYFSGSDTSPELEYEATTQGSGISADNFFLYFFLNTGDGLPDTTYFHQGQLGSFSCGSPPANLQLNVADFGFAVFHDLGICP
jgi:hypothetical protein